MLSMATSESHTHAGFTFVLTALIKPNAWLGEHDDAVWLCTLCRCIPHIAHILLDVNAESTYFTVAVFKLLT